MSEIKEFTQNYQGIDVLITRGKDRKPADSWISLVYGPSKAGKTYFAGSAKRSLFFNIGQGLDTILSDEYKKKFPHVDDIIIIDLSDKNDNHARVFDTVCDVIDNFLSKHSNEFDTVIIDDATFFRREAMNKAYELNAGDQKAHKDKITGLKRYRKPDVTDYGQEMAMIEWFLTDYKSIFKRHKKNFLMTAHPRFTYNKAKSIGETPTLSKITPGFTGTSFPDQIPAFFDDVFYMEVVFSGEPIYQLHVSGRENRTSGTRHSFTGLANRVGKIHNPNYDVMLKHIRGEK